MSRSTRHLLLVAGVVVAMAAAPARADFADYRSIFVSRFEFPYNSPNIPSMVAQIDGMMQKAADEGFTEVVWQVRGRGDALYNSNLEPAINGLTPGFDPLQTAIDAAHARGLKLHAWMNTTPMWNTTALNPPPGHIFNNADPSFRLMDINGNLEPQQGWSNYSSANPVLPQMHAHINAVANDIATNYAVDGIHLDYIRYLPGANNAAADFAQMPHDPISHQMFFDATGLDGANIANFGAYKNFVKGRITDLVASIKNTVDAAEVSSGRTLEYTASVWRDPDVGENDYMQDYRTWMEQDLLDVVMPMIYLSASNDHIYFDANLMNTLNIPSNTRVAPTLASYLHVASGGGGVALTLSEVQRAYNFGADGVNFYSYPAYFNSYSAADRAQLKAFFDEIGTPPPPPVPGLGNFIDDFEAEEGHFGWTYNLSPPSQTNGLAAGTTIERVITEAQSGAASQELNLVAAVEGGVWNLRHNSGIGPGLNANPTGNVPLEAAGSVGVWIKTEDAGVSVQMGIDDPVPAGSTAIEKGTAREVIADNQWHLYQWSFDDWTAFGNAGSDGDVDGTSGTV
nr:family 10 glycosylhydrolase [Pirellulales bacterium]